MKITHLELNNVLIPLASSNLPKPVGRNYGAYMIVRIKCDNEIEGIGEAYCGNGTSAVASVIRDMIFPEIVGKDPTKISELYERMIRSGYYFGRGLIFFYAVSAVEIALWDIFGKIKGLPIYSLLGGTAKGSIAPYPTLRAILDKEEEDNKVPIYASLQTFKNPEEVAIVAKEAVKSGFKSVKLHQIDLGSVKETRKVLEDDIEITVDPNGYFNFIEAEKFIKELSKYNVGWVEEPIWPPDDYKSYCYLRKRSTIPIAGGENESTIWGFERIFQNKAFDIIQPEILAVGGILESFKVFSIAQARNIPIAPHNFRFGPVFSAIIHLSLLFPNVIILETPFFNLEANILKMGPEISQGYAKIQGLPGLGIILDEDVIKDYRINEFPRK